MKQPAKDGLLKKKKKKEYDLFLMNKSVYLHSVILTVIFKNSNPHRERRKFAHKSLVESPTSNFFLLFTFFYVFQLALAMWYFSNGGKILKWTTLGRFK